MPAGERRALEAHLADCAECREVLAETARFLGTDTQLTSGAPDRRRHGRWTIAASVLGAAAVVLLAVGVGAHFWSGRSVRSARPELAQLVAAVGDHRPVEPRLTGGFAYGPPPAVLRGRPSDEISPDVRIAAAEVEKREQQHDTPAIKGYWESPIWSAEMSIVRSSSSRTLPRGSRVVRRRRAICRLRRGEPIPAFGHRLYPAGDPRAQVLLQIAKSSGNARAWRIVRGVWRAGSDVLGEAPNLDFALAAVTLTYRLPDSAPSLLFAFGRLVGWLAHAIEEYASGQLIRPRARYVGPLPESVVAP